MQAIERDPATMAATEIAVRDADIRGTSRMVSIGHAESANAERIDIDLNRAPSARCARFPGRPSHSPVRSTISVGEASQPSEDYE